MVGPTASGKSAIGVMVALQLGDIEIVTADSMQVYRGMDIGTAKPSPDERAGIAHHMIDVADPSEAWDVARFVTESNKVIADIASRGKRALFVGGTGLYVHALVDGFAVPGKWPEVAAELEQTGSTSELHRRLAELDPPAAVRTGPVNRRRVLRALEVTIGSGRPFSSYGPGVGAFPPTTWRLAGVWLPREVVARRIERRFAAMLKAGFADEVRALAARPAGLSRTARQALGYRELLSHVEDGVALDDAVIRAVHRTRQFARRQRMWWRRDPRVRWFGAPENPLAILPALLGDWGTMADHRGRYVG
ncbi:MAG TPA: tRNA (adenosine(37)-N6)-dimethylallyltransferase MiaA [Acidimicrobiales bacterium]|nr:tRNA (adenosine(37)-N6)-dimethylallyltransferase MiaA [Acidimicrobiales bacterium]